MQTILILAAVYGTLVGGELRNAPKVVIVNGYNTPTRIITEPQANALGYKLVVDERPACASNEYAVATGWVLSGLPERIHRTYEKRTIVPAPRRWTPLSIKRSAAKLGHWSSLKAFLVSADAYDDFAMAQYEAEDDADFSRLMSAARQQFGDEVVDAILNGAEVEP